MTMAKKAKLVEIKRAALRTIIYVQYIRVCMCRDLKYSMSYLHASHR